MSHDDPVSEPRIQRTAEVSLTHTHLESAARLVVKAVEASHEVVSSSDVYCWIRLFAEQRMVAEAEEIAGKYLGGHSGAEFHTAELEKVEEDWPVVLSETDEGLLMTERYRAAYVAVLVAEEERERARQAMELKQLVYRDHVQATRGMELTAHSFTLEDMRWYIARYKSPWDEFCAFMDQHYEAFHKAPTQFALAPEDAEVDLGDILGAPGSGPPESSAEDDVSA